MIRLSRAARFNLALVAPALLAAAAALVLLGLAQVGPAIVAAFVAAGWLVGGAALTTLFEPALVRVVSEE
jgi:hypothetical protein